MTFFSHLPEGSLETSGHRVVARFSEGPPVVVDAGTGVPVRARDRGGLDRDTWLARQRRLLALLDQVRAARAARTEVALASEFERLADLEPADPAQRGVALGRAALLYEAAGELDKALEVVQRARRLEPQLYGHWLRELHILARRGADWDIIRHSLLAGDSPFRTFTTSTRDVLLAGILGGDAGDATAFQAAILGAEYDAGEYYTHYNGAIAHLHEARPQEALVAATSLPPDWNLRPEFAYLAALAHLLEDPPRPGKALDLLAPHSDGFGAGHTIPVASLRALARRLDRRDPLPDAAIEDDVRAVADAARTDLVSLYFLPWAHALAAASLEDPDLARRHRDALRHLRGTGPWTPRILALRDHAFPGAAAR